MLILLTVVRLYRVNSGSVAVIAILYRISVALNRAA